MVSTDCITPNISCLHSLGRQDYQTEEATTDTVRLPIRDAGRVKIVGGHMLWAWPSGDVMTLVSDEFISTSSG